MQKIVLAHSSGIVEALELSKPPSQSSQHEQREAADGVTQRAVEIVSSLLEGKRRKSRGKVAKVTQRMSQIGAGATNRRELLARYKKLVEEEFSDLTAWEFCLALQLAADEKQQSAINTEAFAIAAFTGIVIERIGELEDSNPGNLKIAVREAFRQLTIVELFSAFERLTAERMQ